MEINLLDYQEVWEPLAENEQTHVNHQACPAGEDRKERLYIKRVDDGILGYCHHCGEKGYHKLSGLARLRIVEHIGSKHIPKNSVVQCFLKYNPLYHDKNTDAMLYIAQYDLDVYSRYLYHTSSGDIVVQHMDERNGDVALILRQRSPKMYRKYIDSKNHVFEFVAQPLLNYVILVEDCLSAIKLWECGLNAIALTGTNLTAPIKQRIAEYYKGVFVHLDPDIAGIKASVDMAAELRSIVPYFRNSPMSVLKNEPKHIDKDKLKAYYQGEIDAFLRCHPTAYSAGSC
jgi:hypothetical protein